MIGHTTGSSKHFTRCGRPVEQLEKRLLMAANSWKAAVSGDWDDPTRWTAGHVPTATEDAVINLAGSYSVTHARTNADSVHSVVSTHPLSLALGSLNVGTTMTLNGTFTIGGGKLIHATVNGTGPTFSGRASVLDGVTLNSNATVPNGAMVSIAHGLTFQNNHSITLNAATRETDVVFVNANATQIVGGTGQIVFGSSSGALNVVSLNAGTTVLAPGIIVHGKGGTISSLADVHAILKNQGLIDADTPGQTITLAGKGSFLNSGNLMASPGTVAVTVATFSNAGGAMTIGIGGTVAGSSYGVISFSGPAALAGTINTILINNFVPAAGATFAPLRYASHSGSFATDNLDAGNGISFTPTFGAASLSLKAVTGGKSVGFRGGLTLVVTGSNFNDVITVNNSLGVLTTTMNGVRSVFAVIPFVSVIINGNDGNDSITNNTAIPSQIDGGDGNDLIVGGSGADIITGGDGNDTCIGNAGDDIYVFRGAAIAQTDFVSEGAGGGTDTLDFSAVTNAVNGNLSSNTLATMLNRTLKTLTPGQFANFENFFGGAGNDTITGNAAANLLKGNTGNDTFFAAGGGVDTLDGGLGNDSIGSADPTDVKISIP